MKLFVLKLTLGMSFLLSAFTSLAAQSTPVPAELIGLWADITQSWRMVDPSRTWFCSTTGWTYLGSSGSVSSEAITCTTPAGNDLSWGGGAISNFKRSGNEVSFDRSNGVFGRSSTGCHIAATLSAAGMKGTQTCHLKYASPFDEKRIVEAVVQGPYEATRSNFPPNQLQSVGCANEREHKAPGIAGGALVLFENHTARPVNIFPLDRNGLRLGQPTAVPPGSQVPEAVPASNPLVLADPAGTCRAIYIPTTQAVMVSVP